MELQFEVVVVTGDCCLGSHRLCLNRFFRVCLVMADAEGLSDRRKSLLYVITLGLMCVDWMEC